MWCPPVPYQPLPISTGNVGIDRCGNIEVYAAPKVVHARVCWPPCGWPIPPQRWPGHHGCGGFSNALAAVLTQGAPMAEWMVNARRPTG